jgi:hypothetical protein
MSKGTGICDTDRHLVGLDPVIPVIRRDRSGMARSPTYSKGKFQGRICGMLRNSAGVL